MRWLIEYLPLVAFFAVYKFYDIYWATGALIAAMLVDVIYQLVTTKTVTKKTLIFFVTASVFGGLTIFLQNDLFIKWKVSIIYMILGSALIISHLKFNKNLIQELFKSTDQAIDVPTATINKINYMTAVFFFMLAGINLVVAYNTSQETWVNFKVFGITALSFVYILTVIIYIAKNFSKAEQP